MHRSRLALRAAVLLIAALPLAGFANLAAGLAAEPLIPLTPRDAAAPASPQSSATDTTRAERHRPTRGLERAISDLDRNPDKISTSLRGDLRKELKEEIKDVESDLDGLWDELREARKELGDIDHKDGVEGSSALARAEQRYDQLKARWDVLEDELRQIRRDAEVGIEPAPLIARARRLGTAIVLLREAIFELDRLISDAARLERDEE